MAYRDDDKLAFLAPLNSGCETRRLTMKKIAGFNITPVQMTPGYYQCRCAGGTAASTITFSYQTSASVVADTTLTMPAAGAAATSGLNAAPADAWFSLFIHSDAAFLAVAWDGAADDVLILTRMGIA